MSKVTFGEIISWTLYLLFGVVLFLALFLCFAGDAQGATVRLQDNPPHYSKIIEIDGERKILMPDGRLLPFGQGVQCSQDCPKISLGSAETGNRQRLWLWAVPVGAVITTIALWPCDRIIAPVEPMTPEGRSRRETAPRGEVTEPGYLALTGLLFALIAGRMKKA